MTPSSTSVDVTDWGTGRRGSGRWSVWRDGWGFPGIDRSLPTPPAGPRSTMSTRSHKQTPAPARTAENSVQRAVMSSVRNGTAFHGRTESSTSLKCSLWSYNRIRGSCVALASHFHRVHVWEHPYSDGCAPNPCHLGNQVKTLFRDRWLAPGPFLYLRSLQPIHYQSPLKSLFETVDVLNLRKVSSYWRRRTRSCSSWWSSQESSW